MPEHPLLGPKAIGEASPATTATGASEPARHGSTASDGGAPGGLVHAADVAARLERSLGAVVRGKAHEIRLVLCALACGGHVLLEDVPGTAKTVLARALAESIEGAVPVRIQCTPDLQPADVTGASVFDQRTRDFVFRAGPIFANVVLLDEVNRATQKTQSALLEAMAERQVTVDGVTRQLPRPFLLLATENPVEHEGTYLLPEAQLDRFLLRTTLGYPDAADEVGVVRDQLVGHPLDRVRPVVTVEEVLALQHAVAEVYVDDLLQRWVVALVRATRELDIVDLGASVRGSLALDRAVRAWALLAGRDYAVPEDVEALFCPVVGHRVIFTAAFASSHRSLGRDRVLALLLDRCRELAPRPGDVP